MLQRSVMARMLVMGVLLVVLMIPLAMTQGVIAERASRRDDVSRDISRTWGDRQVVTGPVLSVPYRHVVREERVGEATPRESVRTGHLVLLPEQLDVQGRLDPETRARGPFSTVVYVAHLTLRGRFGVPDTSVAPGAGVTFLWDQATVSLGISDPQGIASRLRFVWAGSEARVIPGVDDTGLSRRRRADTRRRQR